MGRKTLLQSTKKKSKTKKNEEAKKRKKAAPAKIGSTKPKATAKAGTTKPKEAVKTTMKTTAAKKKKPSRKELIFKKFDSKMTEKPPKGPSAKTPKKLPEAPPFVSAGDKKETERIRAMLFKQFDLTETSSRETTKKKAITPPPTKETAPKYVSPAPVSPAGAGQSGPISKGMAFGIGLAALLIAILIGASSSNTNNFYLKDNNGAVQIWRGKFAPTGMEKVISIEGMKTPKPIKDIYSKDEVYPLVFKYFEGKADAALENPQGPDFAKIKQYLYQASSYAPTEKLGKKVQLRLKDIDFMILFHKADVAISKGTPADLKSAMAYLNKATPAASSKYQRELINKARSAVKKLIAGLKEK